MSALSIIFIVLFVAMMLMHLRGHGGHGGHGATEATAAAAAAAAAATAADGMATPPPPRRWPREARGRRTRARSPGTGAETTTTTDTATLDGESRQCAGQMFPFTNKHDKADDAGRHAEHHIQTGSCCGGGFGPQSANAAVPDSGPPVEHESPAPGEAAHAQHASATARNPPVKAAMR